jgi:hypothetical protein
MSDCNALYRTSFLNYSPEPGITHESRDEHAVSMADTSNLAQRLS